MRPGLSIALAVQVVTIKFWPDYSQESSWEKRVSLISYFCCCSRRMNRTTEDGQSTPLARMAFVFASVPPSLVFPYCASSIGSDALKRMGALFCIAYSRLWSSFGQEVVPLLPYRNISPGSSSK